MDFWLEVIWYRVRITRLNVVMVTEYEVDLAVSGQLIAIDALQTTALHINVDVVNAFSLRHIQFLYQMRLSASCGGLLH